MRSNATCWPGRGLRAGGERSRLSRHLDRPAVAAAERFVRRVDAPAVTVSFPSVKDVSLGLAYGFYAVCALLSLVFVWKWVEETRGKELEDMHSEAVEPV